VVDDVYVLAHELGHHASWRAGYWRQGEAMLSLREGSLDPLWIDLDAYLACWTLEEGIAEITASAATAEGLVTVRETPAAAVRAGGRRGELELVRRILELAYVSGSQFVIAAGRGAGSLEKSFAAAWARFPATTRALMADAHEDERSRLAAAVRQRLDRFVPVPVAATRVGAFFLRQGLMRHAGDKEEAFGTALDLEDDIVLRWPDGSLLWITRWRQDDAAAAFESFAGSLEGARVRRDDEFVIVEIGTPPDDAVEVLLGR
jgi:hypothetical protein